MISHDISVTMFPDLQLSFLTSQLSLSPLSPPPPLVFYLCDKDGSNQKQLERKEVYLALQVEVHH
jgi:hypothetical protein